MIRAVLMDASQTSRAFVNIFRCDVNIKEQALWILKDKDTTDLLPDNVMSVLTAVASMMPVAVGYKAVKGSGRWYIIDGSTSGAPATSPLYVLDEPNLPENDNAS